jgi:diguanylate cyclase (GGDEF)-like protein
MNIAGVGLTTPGIIAMSIHTSPLDLVKDLRDVRSILSAREKAERRGSPSTAWQQLSLELSLRLQTSLDVEWIIEQFMNMIHAHMLYDGYQYSVSSPDFTLKTGRDQGHSCHYNLSIDTAELGSLVLYRGRKFAESELMLLENLLASLVYPLRNAILYRSALLMAHRDVLTGVNNRSTFDATVTREINLAHRNGSDLAMLVIDIDHFKRVNDTYGHAAGDEVIRTVAQLIQLSVRNTDHVFRYGGEEFVVLLEASDCEKACVAADRILESVRTAEVVWQDQKLSTAVSIGVSCLTRTDSASELFGRADRALYEAKKTGRDQYQIA